jgi:hypothetical protein
MHENTVFLRPAWCFEAEVAAMHENTVFLRLRGCHARKHDVFEAWESEAPKKPQGSKFECKPS